MFRRTYLLLLAALYFMPLSGQYLPAFYQNEKLYREGLDLFDKQKYSAAQSSFEAYLNVEALQYPVDNITLSNAQFYKAICAYHLLRSDAESQLQSFIEQHPTHGKIGTARYYIGKLYYIRQRFEKAIPFLAASDQTELTLEEYEESQFMLGYAYFMTQKHEKALEVFKPICQSNTEHGVHASYYYGIINYNQKNYPEALKAFRSIDNEEPYNAKVPIYISSILLQSQAYDELDQYGQHLIKQQVNFDQKEIIYKQIGSALFELKRYKAAIPYFEANLTNTAKPDQTSFYRLGYSHYQLKEYEPAVFYFTKLVKGQDTLAQASAYYTGYCFVDQNRMDEARLAFHRAFEIGIHPKFTREALIQYGKTSIESKNYDDALWAMREYSLRYPEADNIQEVRGLMGEILFLAGNYRGVIQHFEEIPSKDKRGELLYQKACYNFAVHQHKIGDPTMAKMYYTKASNSNSDASLALTALYWLGELQYQAQSYEDAQRTFKKYQDRIGSNKHEYYPEAMVALGWCFLKSQDHKQAAKIFELAYENPQTKKKPDMFVEAGLRAGDCSFLNKNYNSALKFYQGVYHFKHTHMDYALYQLALCKLRKENRAQALKDLDYLIDNYKQSEWRDDALFLSSTTYLTQVLDNKKALAYAKQLVNEHPSSNLAAKAYLNMGFASAYSEQKDDAVHYFKTVLFEHGYQANEAQAALDELSSILSPSELNDMVNRYQRQYPNNGVKADGVILNVARELVETNKDYHGGIEQLTKFIADFPNSKHIDEAYLLRGIAYDNLNLKDKALMDYNLAIQKAHSSDFKAKALVKAGDIYAAQKEYAKAIEQYSKATQLIENNVDLIQVQFKLGSAYLALKQFSPAQNVFQEIMRNPNATDYSRSRAELQLGNALYGMNRLDSAMKVFTSVEKNNKNTLGAEAQYMRCQVHFDLKQYDAVKKAVFYIKDNYPAHNYWKAKAFMVIAETYRAEGDYFQAIETLKSLIQHSPDKEIRTQAQQRLEVFEVESKDPNLNKNLYEEQAGEEEQSSAQPFEEYNELFEGDQQANNDRPTHDEETQKAIASADRPIRNSEPHNNNKNSTTKPNNNSNNTPPANNNKPKNDTAPTANSTPKPEANNPNSKPNNSATPSNKTTFTTANNNSGEVKSKYTLRGDGSDATQPKGTNAKPVVQIIKPNQQPEADHKPEPKNTAKPEAATYYLIVGTAIGEEKLQLALKQWRDKGFKSVQLNSSNPNTWRISIYQSDQKQSVEQMRKDWLAKKQIPAESWILKQ